MFAFFNLVSKDNKMPVYGQNSYLTKIMFKIMAGI